MIIVWLAVIGATVVTALLTALSWALGRARWPAWRVVGLWAAGLWAINFVLDLLILYFEMPALTGPYGGWQWLLWPLTLSAVYVIFGGSLAQARRSFETLNERMGAMGGGLGNISSFNASGRKRGGGRVVASTPPGNSVSAAAAGGAA